ncbi:MAG: 30S ribosomal protein S6 [Candidatus Pacebacteria bacterium]|nr:30S ribosomal protein S6 [Candidatus Paceibacterota bacterium]
MNYELAYLISGELDEPKAQDCAKKVECIIGSFGKNAISVEPKRIRLAFPVKKQQEGFLASVDFNAEPENILPIAKELEKEKEILRFLIVKKLAAKPEKTHVHSQAAKTVSLEEGEVNSILSGRERTGIKEPTKKKIIKKEKTETADKKEGLKKIEEDLDKILG